MDGEPVQLQNFFAYMNVVEINWAITYQDILQWHPSGPLQICTLAETYDIVISAHLIFVAMGE